MSTLDDLVIATRPQVRLDGQVAAWPSGALLQMAATQSEDGLATLELELLNWRAESAEGGPGFAFEDERDLRLGTEIEVLATVDDDATQGRLFKGRVHALEAVFPEASAPRLVVLAEDRCAALRLARRSERYEQSRASDVVRRLATRHGLSAQIASDFGTTADWLQLGETDLAFVRRLARLHGRRLLLDGQTLAVEEAAQASEGEAPLALDLRADLHSVRVLADLAHQRSSVRVTGFDLQAGQAISQTARQPSPMPGSGRSGPELLSQALGEQEEPLAHHTGLTDAEARTLAQQALDDRARRFLRLRGVAVRHPARLHCGLAVDLTGLGPRFSQRYTVSRVEHRFDLALGLRAEFEAFGAHLGPANAMGGLA